MSAATSILVMGYGNPGRLDDGLGPAFAERVEALGLAGVSTEADYQLTVEDAAEVARYDIVIFADASVSCPAPYECRPLVPREGASFTSHHVEPEQVLYLAHSLFDARSEGYVLGIRGYEFNEFGERLSDDARRNLEAALEFFRDNFVANGSRESTLKEK